MKKIFLLLAVLGFGFAASAQTFTVINTSPCQVFYRAYTDCGSAVLNQGYLPPSMGAPVTTSGFSPSASVVDWNNFINCWNNRPTSCINGVALPSDCPRLQPNGCVEIRGGCNTCPDGTIVNLQWMPGPGPMDRNLTIF